ncbi:MAG TPA: ATP-dependent RecD-like DNA helicase [Ktedonobacterales bacterium]|nr:ATP-dependent RecD-like DNA helicase [Ktedonobacterales bacterium]
MPTLEGAIERIVFRNDHTHFTVARLRPNDAGRLFRGELTTLVGELPGLAVGELVTVSGDWETHPQHGRHLRVRSYARHAPVNAEGLRRYLGSGAIKGIGPKTADRIVARFGEQTLAILDLEPDRLIEVPGVNAHKRDLIVRGWAEQKDVREIMVFLQSHGVSPGLGAKIYRQYGDQSLTVIQENPYQLESDIYGVGFRTADALAVELGLPRDSLPRLMTGIKHVLSEAAGEGHCYLPREEVFTRAATLLEVDAALLPPALEALAGEKEAFVEGEDVYLAPFFYAEMGTARRLRLLLASSPLPAVPPTRWEEVFAALERDRGITLAARQRDAVRRAYDAPVSLLTGGPGTGKTTTVRALLDVLDREGVSYALAAPTGRAAKRLAEATGRAARTLHRLLEFVPATNDFGYNEDRTLPAQFVIVDEVSMLDILLAYRLVRALAPGTHLLLVGDADQLPSVGPGSVLRDLLATERIPRTHLTELFRQAAASAIVVNAHRVNAGELPPLRNDPASDFFFLAAPNPQAAQRLVVDLVARRLPARYGFDPLQDIQVLAPMYRGPVGVQALNELLQARLNPPEGGAPRDDGTLIAPGDKVMQVRNNYDKGTFNGDVGRVIARESETGLLAVRFLEEAGPVTVTYEPHELDELALAYCISIHRAQGSEYPCVVLPLVMQHYLLLQRNLLYTAITRARRLCLIVGDPNALRRAIQNAEADERHTGLRQRLESLTLVMPPS